MTQRRKRVDWDAEIQKAENIRRKGLLMSVVSFGMAVAFIFGITRSTGTGIEIPRTVLFAVIFCVSCVILRVIMRHRAEKRNRRNED